MDKHEIVNRWRLILGDFAENSLPLDPENAELDGTLYFLYNREYTDEQGIRNESGRCHCLHRAEHLSGLF